VTAVAAVRSGARKRARPAGTKRPSKRPSKRPPVRASVPVEAASALAGSIRSLVGQMIDIAGAAADASLGVGGLMARDAGQRRDLARAGAFLRRVREKAGMTIADVSRAVDMKDAELLELAERGKAALPFELILRLAAVLARNDPIPFVLNLTDTYSPAVGRTLKALGVGRLVEHARREHDFITIYRARDAARRLSDAEFARVLAFVEAAFDLALALATSTAAARKHPRRAAAQEDPGPAEAAAE
jgi:transcriptional regulator with XRE-family HTH domain